MSSIQIRSQIQPKQIEISTVRDDFLSGKLKVGSISELVELYSLSEEEAKQLQAALVNEAREGLLVRFYLVGTNRLMKIIESDKARHAIPALKLLGAILGVLEKKPPLVQVQQNNQKSFFYEDLLREVKQQQKAKTEILNDPEADEDEG